MKLFTLCCLFAASVVAKTDGFLLDSHNALYLVDGDSISLQMRIQGIDTPEINQSCEQTPQQLVDCGHLAKRYLKKLLKNLPGQLRIEPMGIDHYQRILVNVYKGDVNIGKRMVVEGMAFSYRDVYRKEEVLAKIQQRGFWGFYQPPITPKHWRKASSR